MLFYKVSYSICALAALIGSASAQEAYGASSAIKAFADNCFNPYLTAETAKSKFASSGARVYFYDLHPFSAAQASFASGRAITQDTDRRCEVSFDGIHTNAGIKGVKTGLSQEGLTKNFDVPGGFPKLQGTEFIAARQLNPNRAAVVQVGTRQGPNGIETFINVERLIPLDEMK